LLHALHEHRVACSNYLLETTILVVRKTRAKLLPAAGERLNLKSPTTAMIKICGSSLTEMRAMAELGDENAERAKRP